MGPISKFRIEEEFDSYISAAYGASSLDRALRFAIRAENVIQSYRDQLDDEFVNYKIETVEDTRRILKEKYVNE